MNLCVLYILERKLGFNMKNFSLSIILLVFFISCSDRTPKLKPFVEDTVLQNDLNVKLVFSPKVDILFVIDDSGSMDSHQQNLTKNITLFIDQIISYPFLDWNIGVMSGGGNPGGPEIGKLKGNPKFVNKSITNYKTALKKNLLLGEAPVGTEVFFEPLGLATTSNLLTTVNKGFFRTDAILAIFILTDAEDQSVDPRFKDPQDIFDHLVNFKGGDKSKLIAYGAIIDEQSKLSGCQADNGFNQETKSLQEFIELTDGSYFDLCDPDYGTQLASIGEDLVSRAAAFVGIPKRPVVDTMIVKYGGHLIPNDVLKGWTYDPDRVGLQFGPNIDIPDVLINSSKLEVDFTPVFDDTTQVFDRQRKEKLDKIK